MKILPVFPAYASGGCDFTSRSSHLESDDVVVLLDVEVDNLSSGMLCVSSATIKSLVTSLGWKLQTQDDDDALKDAIKALAQSLEQVEAYDELLKALERAFAVTPTVGVTHPSTLPAIDKRLLEVVK